MTTKIWPKMMIPAAAGAGIWTAKHRGSLAVKQWRPSTMQASQAGPLHVRVGGNETPVIVLLHGLVATGDVFGAAFDPLTEHSTVVVPDLLGFGRSMDENRASFTPDDHLDALDTALESLGLHNRPLRIGAHSMGAAIALRWLQRRQDQIKSITCYGPPVYADSAKLHESIATAGPMARAFVGNTTLARLACRINCSNRQLAGLIATAITPRLPHEITKSGSLHTWNAYRDAMDLVIAETDWTTLAGLASRNQIPLTFLWGQNDKVGDRSFAATLPDVKIDKIANADHHLPITHPGECIAALWTIGHEES